MKHNCSKCSEFPECFCWKDNIYFGCYDKLNDDFKKYIENNFTGHLNMRIGYRNKSVSE